jgi:lipoyl(octanoyl) transferase
MIVEWKHSTEPVEYMENRAAEVAAGREPELIWMLEHPHVYTLGSSGKATDVLESRCPVIQTGRGGQVTYHGPGQRIVYLVLDLNKRGKDIRAYVRALEEWIVLSLKTFQIDCYRRDGRVGLWVPRNEATDDKIAAIGVRVKRWITLHGISINWDPDLSFYEGIVPCGIADHGVTSARLLGVNKTLDELDGSLKATFHKVFA